MVTAFDFQLHPFTTPVGVGIAIYPAAALTEVIGHYREKTRDAHDDLIIAVNLLTIPDRGPCVTVFLRVVWRSPARVPPPSRQFSVMGTPLTFSRPR